MKRPLFFNFKYTGGRVLKIHESQKGENTIPYAQYVEAKFGVLAWDIPSNISCPVGNKGRPGTDQWISVPGRDIIVLEKVYN